MDIFANLVQPVVNWLHHHPNWSGIITFLISFSESLAIVGSIVPGSVTMTAIGILVGSGVIPCVSTFVWAILGAIAGDSASYFLGYYYRENIILYWPFRKYPQIITQGKAFFELHGGKSVFIGRFLGPLRSIVPIVAGMVMMAHGRFLVANVTSAILWSFLYITPGILLGAATSDLSAETASKLLFYVLIALLVLWLLTHVIYFLYYRAKRFITRHLEQFWDWMSRHPKLESIAFLIRNPEKPQACSQIALLLVSLLFIISFIIVAIAIYHRVLFSELNHAVFNVLQSIRLITIDKIFVIISTIADKKVLISLVFVNFIYLLLRHNKRAAFFWLSNGVVTILGIYFLKDFIHHPRPQGLVFLRHGFSFPSGHTTLATSILGLTAFLIAKPMAQNMRRIVLIPVLTFIALVGFARIYLGVHWLSDIIGGYLFAGSVLFIHLLFYLRKKTNPVNRLELTIVSTLTITLASIAVGYKHFSQDLHNVQPKHKVQIVDLKSWWDSQNNFLPNERLNRFGIPVNHLNLQWAGSIKTIKARLQSQGFREYPHRTFSQAIKVLLSNNRKKSMPLLPQLYQNLRPELIMVLSKPKQPLIVLRLWPSLYQFKNTSLPLWIGHIGYRAKYKKTWLPIYTPIKQKSINAEKLLAQVLNQFDWHQLNSAHVLVIKDKTIKT